MKFSSSNIKKKLYFLKRKLFLYYPKETFSYISGNTTLHFSAQDQRIQKSTPKKFLILQETETSKKFLIFSQKETPKKFFIFQEMELSYIEGNPKKTFRDQKFKKSFLYFGKQLAKLETEKLFTLFIIKTQNILN